MSALGKLILLLYVLCYTAGVAGLFAAILLARAGRGSTAGGHDARFALVSAAFALVVVPYSILAYMQTLGEMAATPVMIIFSVSLVGDAGLILALPNFMGGFLTPPRSLADQKVWIGLAVLAAACGILFVISPLRFSLAGFLPFICLLAAVIHVLVRCSRVISRLRAEASGDRETARWAGILSGFRLLTAAAVVPMIPVDFFPNLFVWRIPGFPTALRLFPILYGGLNLWYVVRSFRPLFKAASPAARSHVTRVYRKLGIVSKEDLMHLARGEPRREA